MDKTIWKYDLGDHTGKIVIPIPSDDITPLAIAFQRNEYGNGLFVWVELLPDEDIFDSSIGSLGIKSINTSTFYVLITGSKVPLGVEYIGTASDPKTNEIVHVYWKNPNSITFLSKEEMDI